MLARTFAALAFVPLLSLSQAQTPAPAQQSTLSTRSTLVLVPALVSNKAGELVYTLSAAEFHPDRRWDTAKTHLEQDTGGEPLALVVVLEIGGAGAREFNRFASIAPPMSPMLESIIGNVPHKVAVVTFDSQPALLQDFTADIDTAASALETLTIGCTRQHHLENCASPLAVRLMFRWAITEPLSSTASDSLSIFCENSLSNIAGQFCWSVKRWTAEARSASTMPFALSAIPTPPSTASASQPENPKRHTIASRELPTQPGALWMENHHPQPSEWLHGQRSKS